MREDLIGYLLGSLEPDEMRRVEQWLREDETARAELADLERILRPLEDGFEVEPPPSGLIERTLANLPSVSGASAFEEVISGQDSEPGSPLFDSPERESEPRRVALGSSIEPPGRSHRSWLDWVGASVAAAILLCLLIPMLAEGRFSARRAACQDQLREFGTAITEFVMLNQQQRLPPLAETGPEAFAGIYTLRLFDAGLLHDFDNLHCPSLDHESKPEPNSELTALLACKNLQLTDPDTLSKLQHQAGGDYAYSLGVMDDDHYATPRYEGRSTFAVMSDAPLVSFFEGEIDSAHIGHDGRGINILYEDGRVIFVSVESLGMMPDHPWLNDRGSMEAGVNVDDAVLAPSSRPPFLGVSQR